MLRESTIIKVFQSTFPVRGRTAILAGGRPRYRISIHLPREGKDYQKVCEDRNLRISIHLPREGKD